MLYPCVEVYEANEDGEAYCKYCKYRSYASMESPGYPIRPGIWVEKETYTFDKITKSPKLSQISYRIWNRVYFAIPLSDDQICPSCERGDGYAYIYHKSMRFCGCGFMTGGFI